MIPCLLLHKGGLFKSVRFNNYQYVGDPINAVKIFNEKEVDEIVLLDIDATREKRGPNTRLIAEISSEAFMPMAYGGGIKHIDEIKELFFNGLEKVVINQAAHTNPALISEAAKVFGSQSVVVSIDVKRTYLSGLRVFTGNGSVKTGLRPAEFAKRMEDAGAGEILLNSIDADGTYEGYNLKLIKDVSNAVSIPLVAIGGAATVSDFGCAKRAGASGVAAGSLFIFKRPHNAVLINYPTQEELKTNVFDIV